MKKTINFGPGPAMLPEEVKDKAQKAIQSFNGSQLSILEVGHRSKEFIALMDKMIDSVTNLLDVPEDYAIIFLPAGAQNQFSMINMNLLGNYSKVGFVDTGHWSSTAITESKKYAEVHIAASSKPNNYHNIPDLKQWDIPGDAAFLHYTDNETIGGVEFSDTPLISDLPLVSDMSSNIFSRPVNFNNLGCLYACAQKNMGIAGMSLVIVRKDLLDRALPTVPKVFHYASQYKKKSMVCTPPTFPLFVASLMFDWIEKQGGVNKLNQLNKQKSRLLYDFIDNSQLYNNPVEKPYRSRMNLPFTLKNPDIEADFLNEAANEGLVNLKGHRSVGGMRASIYNAMTIEDVNRLIQFMEAFESKHA